MGAGGETDGADGYLAVGYGAGPIDPWPGTDRDTRPTRFGPGRDRTAHPGPGPERRRPVGVEALAPPPPNPGLLVDRRHRPHRGCRADRRDPGRVAVPRRRTDADVTERTVDSTHGTRLGRSDQYASPAGSES